MRALFRFHDLVQRVDIGLGRGDDDIRVGALAIDDAPALFQTHGHLALRVGAGGDVVDRVQQQFGAAVHDRLYRPEGGVHRAAAFAAAFLFLAVHVDGHRGHGGFTGFRTDLQRHQLDPLVAGLNAGVGYQCLQILVVDLVLLVGQFLEAGKGFVQLGFGVELHAQFLQARAKGIAPGMLAQHHAVGGQAHVFGTHDLVGLAMLEHAVLMNAGLVGEGIGADDGLVGLHRKAGNARHQPRAVHDPGGVEVIHGAGKNVAPGFHRHHHFLQRGIAGPLAQTIDGAFHLARAIHHRGQRVGRGQAEIVVAMHREHGLVRIGNALAQVVNQGAELGGDVVAHGIGNVHRGRPGLDHRLQHPAQETQIRTPGILRRELHVVGILARLFHRTHRLFQHLLRAHAQLALHMNRRGGDEGVNAPGVGRPERLAGAFDVLVQRPRQTADGAVLDRLGHGPDRLEVTGTGNRKTGLDDIHMHFLQRPGDTHFFIPGHGGAGTLFTVAQGGVEYD